MSPRAARSSGAAASGPDASSPSYDRDGDAVCVPSDRPGPYAQVRPLPRRENDRHHISRPYSSCLRGIWLMRIWIREVVAHQYDFGKSINADPVWSPDSRRIAFVGFRRRSASKSHGSDALDRRRAGPRGVASDRRQGQQAGRLVFRTASSCSAGATSMPLARSQFPNQEARRAVGESATRLAEVDQMHFAPDGRLVAYNTIGPDGRKSSSRDSRG